MTSTLLRYDRISASTLRDLMRLLALGFAHSPESYSILQRFAEGSVTIRKLRRFLV